jgi:hypothetical protein
MVYIGERAFFPVWVKLQMVIMKKDISSLYEKAFR